MYIYVPSAALLRLRAVKKKKKKRGPIIEIIVTASNSFLGR